MVYLELPEVGRQFEQGAQFGSIESVKAVSDLYCPLAGRVTEVNAALAAAPETVNADPHGTWMMAIELTEPAAAAGLLEAAAYAELVK